jgi:hypothetical protein
MDQWRDHERGGERLLHRNRVTFNTMGSWIIPKQLRTSVYAPVTEVWTLGFVELSEVCGQLLMRRSTHSQSKYYLREWKRGNLIRLRSGLIYGISRGNRFTDAWTSLVRAIHASHSAMPDSAKERTMSGISGPTSSEGSSQSDLQLSFSKTSRVISRWDSPASSAIWKSWVTGVRGESLARRNAVRRIAGTESSSLLPTPCANEDSFRLNGSSQQSKTLEAMARRGELSGPTFVAGPLNPSFVEMMMGVPIGWTAYDSSETGSSQQPPL